MNRDFWRGALSVALILGTLSFLESVGSEPLPGWTRSPRDLDLPASKRPVDKPRLVVQRPMELPEVPEPPELPESPYLAMIEDECAGDCEEYGAGFSWAAVRAVSDPRQCPDRSESFVDGCKSFVRQMRGENDEPDEEDSGDESDKDHSERDSGNQNWR